jgi:superfamily I DNA/RNA helicase
VRAGTALCADDLLADLTAPQQAAVTSRAAPLCILACAGAGKTRVLTRRIAYRCLSGETETKHTLALTFTRKAALELKERLGALGLGDQVAAGTFHSHALAQLQRWWADRRQSPPAVLDRKSRLLGPLVEGRPGLEKLSLPEVAAVIEWAQARVVDPGDLEAALAAAGRHLPGDTSPAAVAGVYSRYQHEKRRRGLVDFDDLLSRCAEAMERDPEFAGAQRWWWRHVYVDEFQDVNPLQHRLLLAWLGPTTDLCVVGDPNQAIYGWNGADPRLLADMPRRWESTEILRLGSNHRSTDQIVRAAAAVLGREGSGLSGSGRLGAEPAIRRCPSEAAEAASIAAEIRRAAEGGLPWSEMAVLTRTNAQLEPIAAALCAADVPCRYSGTSPADGVVLCSFHRAKGLEWRWVWIAGVEEGLVPMARSSEVEERQLLYVALTRASEQVLVSWSETRVFGAGRGIPRQPSRWLEAILSTASAPSAGAASAGEDPAAWRHRLEEQRSILRRSSSRRPSLARSGHPDWPEPDPDIHAALVAWRLDTARHSGVPPRFVLHDLTLDALAALRPQTTEELLAVPAVGPLKAQRYGPALLDILAQPVAYA